MKNRTIIGLICLALAVIVTFAVGPLVTKIRTQDEKALRLTQNVGKGMQITADLLETVSVKAGTLPKGVLTEEGRIVGKYAASDLYAGDYLTEEKIGGKSAKADDILAALDGTKVAVSVPIRNFAAGLSGKLENGDIVSVLVTDAKTGSTAIPPELTYVRVITATTAKGVDADEIVPNDDGSRDAPGTVTVLVSTDQARLLASFQKTGEMSIALVYRGDAATARSFLDRQEEYFAAHQPPDPGEVSE